jgi:SAM-dependent methyltransferase
LASDLVRILESLSCRTALSEKRLQYRHGLYRLLESARFYEAFQNLLGASEARQKLLDRHVRATPENAILDIGCGPASIYPFLPEGIRYTGYDLNPEYIATAKERWGNRVTLHAQAVDELNVDLASYNLVVAFSLLHHLDDREADALFATAVRALKPGGRLVTVDPAFVDGQSPIARRIIARDRGRHVRTPDAYAALARKRFAHVAVTVHHDLLRIPYTHVVLEAGVA